MRKQGIRLGVNIDHIATLRQLRGTPYPDILEAAHECEKAGADQITVHLREDRRHIQDNDVRRLKQNLKIPLNLEMALAPEIVRFAERIRPDWACFVPEKRREVTTEGGLEVSQNQNRLARALKRLHAKGVRVSLFIEPTLKAVRVSAKLGAEAVELHTGRYALITQRKKKNWRSRANTELERVKKAAVLARELGLRAHAGHGLDYENTERITRLKGPQKINAPLVQELNIGHSVVCRAALQGLPRAVREMRQLLRKEQA